MNGVDDLTDEQNKQLLSWLQPQGAGVVAPSASGVPSTPPAGGTTPPLPPAASMKTDPEDKIADSHPGVQPGALDQYIQGQEKQVDAFGPEKQAALMQHLQQGYKSPGNLLAKGGATLADAIMQGVARAGSSGNLAAINEREKANLDRTAELGKSLQEQNLKVGERKQGLEELSPNTPLGASGLPIMQAVAKMYGMPPEAGEALAKSNPQAAMRMLEKVGEFATGRMKTEIEQQLKLLEIQVQSRLGQQGKDIEAARARQEAAKAIAAGSVFSPGGPTRAQKLGAQQTLAGVAGEPTGQPQKVSSRAEFDALPSGAQFIDDSGKVKTKK